MEISAIIPVYNELSMIQSELPTLARTFADNNIVSQYKVIVVENGSHDGSRQLLDDHFAPKKNFTVINKDTADYNAAILSGLNNARYRYCFISDIDCLAPSFIEKSIRTIKSKECALVQGSKVKGGQAAKRPLYRNILTAGHQYLINIFFGYNGTHTKGSKLLDCKRLDNIPGNCTLTTGSAIGTELVLRAKKQNKTVIEVSQPSVEKRPTSFNLITEAAGVFAEMVKLYYALYINEG